MREESTVLNFVYLNLGLAPLDSTVDLSNEVNLLFGACNLLFPACPPGHAVRTGTYSGRSGLGIEELYAGGRKGESTLQIRNPQSAIRN